MLSAKDLPVLISMANLHDVDVQNWHSWSVFAGLDLARRTNQSKKELTECSSPMLSKMKAHRMDESPSNTARRDLGCQVAPSCWTRRLSDMTRLLVPFSFFANGLISPLGRKVRTCSSSPKPMAEYILVFSCSHQSLARTVSAPSSSWAGKTRLRPPSCWLS